MPFMVSSNFLTFAPYFAMFVPQTLGRRCCCSVPALDFYVLHHALFSFVFPVDTLSGCSTSATTTTSSLWFNSVEIVFGFGAAL
mmetsp:Transcript_11111/g.30696  ORF Transcript_11111/g.30696 Transcript_11111/m.30696 type:complete len:84 (-) Transcript_11111:50-301(-)